MKSLLVLRKEALAACELRGHTMGKWDKTKTTASCKCLNCEGWVQVETKPAPNSIDIGGSAVGENCPVD